MFEGEGSRRLSRLFFRCKAACKTALGDAVLVAWTGGGEPGAQVVAWSYEVVGGVAVTAAAAVAAAAAVSLSCDLTRAAGGSGGGLGSWSWMGAALRTVGCHLGSSGK